MDNTNKGIVSHISELFTDPFRAVEGICQIASDKTDENGLWYAFSYINTSVGMEVLIDRGISAVVGNLKGILKHVDDVVDESPKDTPDVDDEVETGFRTESTELKIDSAQFGKKVGKHARDFGLNPSDLSSREIIYNKIHDIYNTPDVIKKGDWRGLGDVLPNGSKGTGPAKFYIKGNDVVVTDMNDKFIVFVEKEAEKKGKVFILDSGEGRETYDEKYQFDVEDLSGWLLDKEQKEMFVKARKEGKEYEQFNDDYIFVEWERTLAGKLIVKFRKY